MASFGRPLSYGRNDLPRRKRLSWLEADAPYQRGGSSRFFTLAAAIIPDDAEPALNRVARALYKRRARSTQNELKSVQLSAGERLGFAAELAKLRGRRADIEFVTITVRKENANAAFRRHPKGLSLQRHGQAAAPRGDGCPRVGMLHSERPDARSRKVEHKDALYDYLCTEAAADCADTVLQTTPCQRRYSLALQFVDLVAGIVREHHEHRNCEAYRQRRRRSGKSASLSEGTAS
ncbi:hypothetical protein [Paraburkholderia sediminicola]|uniref:hypothetical protein n=1 Tax=Paraburkholderia sediminicola TaxID=458836 RepID=UPI0038BB3D65